MFFFKNYKTIIFIVVLIAVALIVLSYNLKRDSQTGLIKKVVLELAAPVQKSLSAFVERIANAWSRYIFLVNLQAENENLAKEISELKSKLILYQEGYLELQRLHNLLAVKDNYDFKFITCRVIGREQFVFAKSILINKGTAHGVHVGMPVITGHGLIGRVIDASWHTAKVLLLIDESSNIAAIVQRNRTQGVVSGAGSRGCVLKYISKTQDVQEGDIIVSSGMGGVFPKGLMIGTVSSVDKQEAGLFLKINVAPSIDSSKLEEVLVLASTENEGK